MWTRVSQTIEGVNGSRTSTILLRLRKICRSYCSNGPQIITLETTGGLNAFHRRVFDSFTGEKTEITQVGDESLIVRCETSVSSESKIVVASHSNISIKSFSDISNALGACLGKQGLILTEKDLAPEFFDLHTGLAGELFQKFINYKVRVAIVLPDPEAYGERLSELAYEHASHNMIRFVRTEDEARIWLRA